MDGGGFCSSIRKFKGNPLDVVDHGEYFGFVNAGRITFWWKNRETDALQSARNSHAWIDLRLVKTRQHTFYFQVFFAVLK